MARGEGTQPAPVRVMRRVRVRVRFMLRVLLRVRVMLRVIRLCLWLGSASGLGLGLLSIL